MTLFTLPSTTSLVGARLQRWITMCLVLVVGSTIANPAHAGRGGGFVVYSNGDTIAEVADLPDDGPTGEANIGWKHYEFELFWMPLWAGEGSYVLYEESGDSYDYSDITAEQAQELGAAAGMDVSPPGILSLYWGWVGVLILVVILGMLKLLPDDDD